VALRKLLSNNPHVCLAPKISPGMMAGSRARETAGRSSCVPCYVLNLPQDDNVSEL